MEKLKVVSIGGFGHSNLVFDEMVGMQEAELVGFASAYPSEDISVLRCHELCNDVTIYENYREMILRCKPNVAVVSTRLDLIPQIAIDAAEAGCHLVCEKPLAFNRETLLRVYDSVNSNSVKLTLMLSMRNESVFRTARQLYKSGVVGEAVLVNGLKSYKYGDRPSWFGERSKYGGTIGWVGIHALDFINYITGLDYISVAAMKGNFAHQHFKYCEDNCVLVLGMSNGGHATVSIDYFRPKSAETHGDDRVRIVGTKGVIEANVSQNWCRVIFEQDGFEESPLLAQGSIFKDFLLSLIGKSNYDTQRISFMLNDVCINAKISAETGTFMKIDNSIWK